MATITFASFFGVDGGLSFVVVIFALGIFLSVVQAGALRVECSMGRPRPAAEDAATGAAPAPTPAAPAHPEATPMQVPAPAHPEATPMQAANSGGPTPTSQEPTPPSTPPPTPRRTPVSAHTDAHGTLEETCALYPELFLQLMSGWWCGVLVRELSTFLGFGGGLYCIAGGQSACHHVQERIQALFFASGTTPQNPEQEKAAVTTACLQLQRVCSNCTAEGHWEYSGTNAHYIVVKCKTCKVQVLRFRRDLSLRAGPARGGLRRRPLV